MELLTGMVYWLLLNLITLATATRLALLVNVSSTAGRIVAFGQYCAALIVGSMLLAGSWHQLTVGWLIAVQVLAFSSVVVASRHRQLHIFAGVAAGLATFREILRSDRLLGAGVAVAVIVYLYVIAIGWIFPPATGDELLYHLPVAMSFVQQESLQVPPLSGFWKASLWAHYPANGSLLAAWMLLSGTDRFVDLVQLAFVVFGVAAVHGIGRSLGLGRTAATWAGLLYACIPLVINQARTALNDVVLAFCVLAVLYWILSFRPERRLTSAVLAAVPAGLAFGIKYAAAAHLGLLLVTATGLFLLARRGDWPAVLKDIATGLAAGAVCVLLLGGYWYARNFVLTGSATYPLPVLHEVTPGAGRFFDIASFRMLFDDALARPGNMLVPVYFNRYNANYGIGIQSIALAFPVAFVLACRLLRARFDRAALLAVAFLAGYFGWWMIAPADATGRYALPWIGLGLVLAVQWFAGAGKGGRAVRITALAMVCISGALALPSVGSDISGVSIVNGFADWRRTGRLPDPYAYRGGLTLYDYRDAWGFLAGERPKRIAAVNQAFTYPLYGTRSPWNELVFPSPETRDDWLRDLLDHEVDYVIASPLRCDHAVISEPPSAGWRLTITLASGVQSCEMTGMQLGLGGRRASGITIRYRTNFRRLSGEPTSPSGTFYMAVNRAAVLEPLKSTASPVDETGVWQTLRLNLEDSPVVEDLGILYTDRPVSVLPVEAAIVIDGIFLDDGGIEASQRVDTRMANWRPMQRPIEEYWIEQLPDYFSVAGTFPDAGQLSASGAAVTVYEVLSIRGATDNAR